MNNTSSSSSTDTPRVAKPRKPYHTPRLENYGAVNELTRGGTGGYNPADGPSFYGSGA